MSEKHFKSNPFYKQPSLNVNKKTGTIDNIVIVQFGKNKNGSYFNKQFLIDLVRDGNSQSQGVKSRFGHPNMCSTSLGTYLGRFNNFMLDNNRVLATLKLDDTAKATPTGNLYDYVLNMAESNPDMFGNSIVISSEEFEEEIDNEGEKETVWSHKLDSFVASDIVDSPAATDALFENADDLGTDVTAFLDDNPQVFEAITKKPDIIFDFFSRYISYHNKKFNTNENMSLLDQLKKVISPNKKMDIDVTLADGEIITVVTEAESPQVGDEVKKDDGTPVEDKEHIDKDGNVIVTVDSNITELKPVAEEEEGSEEEAETSNEQVMQSVSALDKKVDKLLEKFSTQQKSVNEFNEGILHVGKEVAKIKENYETLAASVGSDFSVDDEGEQGSSRSLKDSMKSTSASLKARKQEIKKG